MAADARPSLASMGFLTVIGFIASVAVVAGTIAGIVQIFLTQANERRRTQGIIIAHETRPCLFGDGGWKVEAAITNEGQGPAFNVRFGVSAYGVRYPFRLEEGDPLSGNRQRVVRPQQRIPESGGWPIPIPSLNLYGGAYGQGEPPEEDLYYWARFEDVRGLTYETVNPPARSADLKIRRVRFVGLREHWNERKHRRAGEQGIAWEEKVREEFRQGRAAAGIQQGRRG